MNSYHLFMERFWLLISIISFVYGVYMIGKFGLAEAGIYLVMPAVAGALFYLRFYTRKRMKNERENEN